jgi:predicted nucleic-acid-binding Zn-ribbon protein
MSGDRASGRAKAFRFFGSTSLFGRPGSRVDVQAFVNLLDSFRRGAARFLARQASSRHSLRGLTTMKTPGSRDTKPCPKCGGTAVFRDRVIRPGGNPGREHRAVSEYVAAWTCENSECDYFEPVSI